MTDLVETAVVSDGDIPCIGTRKGQNSNVNADDNSTPAPPQPEHGRCTYFIPNKGRYCRFHATPDGTRCGNHPVESETKSDQQERIPCPLDPSHSVYKSRLSQHLKVCSKLRQEEIQVRLPFFNKGVNLASGKVACEYAKDLAEEPAEQNQELKQVLLQRLELAYPRAVACVIGPDADPEVLLERSVLSSAGNVSHAEKHEAQNVALTSKAVDRSLLREDSVVVEYGCGRAGLATAICAERPGLRYVLVDRDARRHKIENREEHRVERTLRLRLDIADFDLASMLSAPLTPEQLPRASDFQSGALVASGNQNSGPAERLEQVWQAAAALQSAPWPPQHVLACAKHLCGGATDIALRSVLRRGGNVDASICIATCCHHRCDDVTYVNLPFLKEIGLCGSGGEFEVLASLAGWAVGGRGDVQARRRQGMMVKRCLDLGRVAWIREHLSLQDAAFVEYIEKNVTPENFAIIAGSNAQA